MNYIFEIKIVIKSLNMLHVVSNKQLVETNYSELEQYVEINANMIPLSEDVIISLLRNFPNLRILQVGGTLFRGSSVPTPEYITKVHTLIAEALRDNTNITHFYYFGNKVGDENVGIFTQVLETHPSLVYFDISSNNIYADGNQLIDNVNVIRAANNLHPIVFENKFNFKKSKTVLQSGMKERREAASEFIRSLQNKLKS